MSKAQVTPKYRPPNTIIWFGDSITMNGGRTDYSPARYNGNGFWCWAQFLTGHIFNTVANLGVTGEQTPTMVARFTQVLSLRPGYVHILAGINDVTHSGTYASITQDLGQMLDMAEGAGIRAIIGTLTPTNSLTAPQRLLLNQVNQWIRFQGRVRSNVIVVDYYEAVVTQSGGTWAGSGTLLQTNDGTHPSATGAYVMGQALANAVKAAGIVGGYDTFCDESDTTNALLYSQFAGAGVGAAPTGWVPSAVSNSGTVAYSKTPRTDLPLRNWQTLVITPSSPGVAASMSLTDVNHRVSAWAVGDTIVGVMECQLSALDQAPATAYQAGATLSLQCTGGTAAQADDLYWVNNSSSYPNHSVAARQGLFRTPPLVIPAGTTMLRLILTLGGGGTYNLDRSGIINVSRYGMAS